MYPDAYVQFLVQFHAHRDYFECHEILEDYWKETDPGNRFSPWVGLIQTAVGLYHYRRQNWRGAEKILKSAHRILQENRTCLGRLAIDADRLLQQIDECRSAVLARQAFQDINLPLTDEELSARCREESARQQAVWLSPSDLTNDELIHRHILRYQTKNEQERLRKKRNL